MPSRRSAGTSARTASSSSGLRIPPAASTRSGTVKRRWRGTRGSGFSIEPRILQSAWFRPHNVSEELPGLYLVGAGTHPGAGLPGVLSSAKILDMVVPHATERV